MPNQKEDHMKGTAISVVLGLLACALGGMCSAASSSASDNREVLAGLGTFLLVVGALAVGIGILAELFAIRPAIAKSHQATLSLLSGFSPGPHQPASPLPDRDAPKEPSA